MKTKKEILKSNLAKFRDHKAYLACKKACEEYTEKTGVPAYPAKFASGWMVMAQSRLFMGDKVKLI